MQGRYFGGQLFSQSSCEVARSCQFKEPLRKGTAQAAATAMGLTQATKGCSGSCAHHSPESRAF